MLWYSLTQLSMIRILLWFQILRICLACSFSASLSLIGRCPQCALVSLRLIALIANTRYGVVRGVWKETLILREWFSNNLSRWNMYNIWKSEKMCPKIVVWKIGPKKLKCEKLCLKNWSVKNCDTIFWEICENCNFLWHTFFQFPESGHSDSIVWFLV